MTDTRIYLSPPDVGDVERKLLLEAFDSNWVAPVGPDLDAFEAQVAEVVGVRHAVALSSGTAALHLALVAAGVRQGDTVLVPSFTFAATANAVMYLGARPVFLDSTAESWNVDPALVAEELRRRAARGKPPRAVIACSWSLTRGALSTLPWETSGLAPTMSRKSVRARSGIGTMKGEP